MPFRARNPYYLQISRRSVLPLYVFLDERHIDWMTDRVLQYVLADLRPLILPKLKAEADAHLGPGGPPNAKKGTVDVHKGEFYQFCFFFRKTEPHSVLIKTRSFVTAPPQSKLMPPPPNTPSSRPGKGKSKRKGRTLKEGNKESSRKKPKTKGKGKARVDFDEDNESAVSSEEDNPGDTESEGLIPVAVRRSGRAKKLVAGGYVQHHDTTDPDTEMTMPLDDPPDAPRALTVQPKERPTEESQPNEIMEQGLAADVDAVMHDTGTAINITNIDLEVEDEEQKPKPMLQLRYQGFGIYGHCLCVVVEPFPPIRSSRAPSVAPQNLGFSSARERREGKPLFLPEYDRRSETPAPFPQKSAVPLFDHPRFGEADEADSDDDNGGMLEFSQVLNAASDFRAGGALDNDDEMDGAVFFGDADEGREL